jgi:hypothetical protein
MTVLEAMTRVPAAMAGAAKPTLAATLLHDLPYALPFLVVGFIIAMGALMGAQSGWYALARRFRDRSDPALATFRYRSAWFGRTFAFNGVLNFGVCRTGLRVGIVRIVGPFSNDFFVPWDEITITRGNQWLGPAVRLQLGDAGSLSLRPALANDLARAAGDRWPEPGPFPAPTGASIASGVLREWVIYTAAGSAVLMAIPLLLAPHGRLQPLHAIGAAAVLAGIGALIEFGLRSGRQRRAMAKEQAARPVDAPPPGS